MSRPPTGNPRGRPPKPATLARIHGDRPRPPAAPVRPALTDPPATLTAAESVYWREYAGELQRLNRLTVLSAPALADLCRWMVLADGMRAQVAADGLTVTGQRGEPVRHPLIMPLSTVANQITVGRNAFGIHPQAHERFGLVDQDESPNSDLLSG